MKRIAFVLALVLATFSFAFAAQDVIEVQLDGVTLNFTDSEGNTVNPQMINNRTMVPMRKIFEAFEAEVEWDEPTKTVVAKNSAKEITLTIDNNRPTVKDLATGVTKTLELDQAPVIRDNRTLVPVRFIAESLDKNVSWDQANRVVVIIDLAAIADDLRAEVPGLQKLFDMNLAEINSYTADSTLKANLAYKGTEAEKIAIDGKINVAFASMDEFKADFDVNCTGNGQVFDEFKEAGYEHTVASLVLKQDKLMLGIKSNDEYVWQDVSSQLSTNQVSTVVTGKTRISSYEEFVNELMNSVGTVNKDSYNLLSVLVEFVKDSLGGDNIKYTKSGNKEVVSMKVDLGQFLSQLLDNSSSEFEMKKLAMEIELTVENGVLKSDVTKFDMDVTNVNGESMVFDAVINSTYTSLNQPVSVSLPN